MLKKLFEQDLIAFPDVQPGDWKEAIAMSCTRLLDQGIINRDYVQEIIASVEKYGPYIVIIPEVAMPHADPHSPGVFGTAIAMTKFKEEVVFYDQEAQEEKPAKLFFTLAAKDADAHLENISQLTDLLTDEEMVEKLKAVQSLAELKELI